MTDTLNYALPDARFDAFIAMSPPFAPDAADEAALFYATLGADRVAHTSFNLEALGDEDEELA